MSSRAGSAARVATLNLCSILALAGPLAAIPSVRADDTPATIDFNREVRPILARSCFPCHGPDENSRKGELRLDLREAALAGGASGVEAIVPGDPDLSELLFRVAEEDETVRMPPEGERLGPDEVAALRRWVEQGGDYDEHWAFVPPQARALPAVGHASWPRNGIDHWVLARLEAEGLEPSEEADPYSLLRRVSIDLRGLPPTPEEVEQFIADAAPGAYERAVDRFLDDPAYGERWARVWLDLARYADSAGYGSDPLRPQMWRYRNWVIDAFNRNLPYDQFTTEQLAGDLLPEPTLEQKVATAFHRNTMTNTEGGTDDEEFRVAAIKDRTDTTMQVWMGLTMGCAQCHSHKYDPISHDEYYSVFAVFNQTEDTDQPSEAPTLLAPTPEQAARIAEIDPRLDVLRRELDEQKLDPAKLCRDEQPEEIIAILDIDGGERTKEQKDKLEAHLRSLTPELQPLRDEIAALEKARPEPPRLPILSELPAERRRTTHLLNKGNFLDPGHEVQPGVLEAFHPLPEATEANRLGLASWLTDPANPLTARVAVNRFWGQLLGAGLVETEEDFGTQGEPPSHPELLDWLAIEYQRSGWDTKALLKLIATSATYRQSSKVTPELIEQDPRNRLLARAPRYRLEAEMVRDQALALSGLLTREVGGPSVYPPQPEGLWQAAFNGERTWATSEGPDRYRRGLYTFWRRTVPYPSMAAFDAPSRELCTVRRTRTNTPLQAFVTLNDPVYVEAAQALGRRLMDDASCGDSPEDRVRAGLRLVLCRPAEDGQVEVLAALYSDLLDHYREDPEAATALATDPIGPLPDGADPAEAAAWTAVANVLLNLDGVLTKG